MKKAQLRIQHAPIFSREWFSWFEVPLLLEEPDSEEVASNVTMLPPESDQNEFEFESDYFSDVQPFAGN